MTRQLNIRPFIKMHGLGNDFIIFDARNDDLEMSPTQVNKLSDRRHGIGCDQLIVMKQSDRADVYMEIWNADGSRVDACGNATRCIGHLIDLEKPGNDISIETGAGIMMAKAKSTDIVTVDMGVPKLEWQDIPIARQQDTMALDLEVGPFKNPVAVNVGNPHAIFFVKDATAVPIEKFGPTIETHAMFPEQVNVSAASVEGDIIRLRVWERGVGMTPACGTAACATIVAASLRGLVNRRATLRLDGGDLDMVWREDNHVMMTGPVATSFKGEIAL